VIYQAANQLNCGTNDATLHLVKLALENADHEPMPPGGQKAVTRSLSAPKGFFAETVTYRIKHGLPNKKAAFLKDALPRGAAVYKNGAGY
jgi:hypothetical protein